MKASSIPAMALAVVLAQANVSRAADEQEIKLADCPAAVQKTLKGEAKGLPIDGVTKETDEDATTYWATVVASGRKYAIGVAEDGTLQEVSLEADEEAIPFAKCPAVVQATLHHESKDAKIDTVDRDFKYGTLVFQTVVTIGARDYMIVVAQDGTLVEKSLVIEEDEIELTKCPSAVQKSLHEQAGGGKIGSVTRSTGIVGHVYEASLEIDGKSYTVEVAENGILISKWIDDDE